MDLLGGLWCPPSQAQATPGGAAQPWRPGPLLALGGRARQLPREPVGPRAQGRSQASPGGWHPAALAAPGGGAVSAVRNQSPPHLRRPCQGSPPLTEAPAQDGPGAARSMAGQGIANSRSRDLPRARVPLAGELFPGLGSHLSLPHDVACRNPGGEQGDPQCPQLPGKALALGPGPQGGGRGSDGTGPAHCTGSSVLT